MIVADFKQFCSVCSDAAYVCHYQLELKNIQETQTMHKKVFPFLEWYTVQYIILCPRHNDYSIIRICKVHYAVFNSLPKDVSVTQCHQGKILQFNCWQKDLRDCKLNSFWMKCNFKCQMHKDCSRTLPIVESMYGRRLQLDQFYIDFWVPEIPEITRVYPGSKILVPEIPGFKKYPIPERYRWQLLFS